MEDNAFVGSKFKVALVIVSDGFNMDEDDWTCKVRNGVREVEDITDIDGAVLDALSCGDKVIKVTGKQKHAYTVSYKGEGVGEGVCLTYADAAGTETVSYDYTESGWAYNSTDKGEFA